MKINFTAEFADDVFNFRFERIPKDIIIKAKQILLDTIGVILAATSPKYSAGRILTELSRMEGGTPECTLIGRDFKTSCIQACLVNGTMGYYCDNEPVHFGAILHPAAVCIPTSLAFAEREHKDGKAFLAAMTLGIEVCCKVSYAINPQALYRRGFHPTSIACGFGAFASGAHILGLNQKQIINGLGLAGNQASGLLAWESDLTENSRPFNPGIAARNGATSALLSGLGFGGPISIFDGKYNMFKAFSDGDERPEELIDSEWKIKGVAHKLHACCAFNHTGLDGLLELMEEYNLNSQDIQKIELYCPKFGAHMIDNNKMKSHRAQYVFAVAAVKREVVIDDILQNYLDNPEIDRLSKNINVFGDDSLGLVYPSLRESIVKVYIKDGRKLEKHIYSAKGTPQNPISDEDLKKKFLRTSTALVSTQRALDIIDCINNIENQKNVDSFCALLQL